MNAREERKNSPSMSICNSKKVRFLFSVQECIAMTFHYHKLIGKNLERRGKESQSEMLWSLLNSLNIFQFGREKNYRTAIITRKAKKLVKNSTSLL